METKSFCCFASGAGSLGPEIVLGLYFVHPMIAALGFVPVFNKHSYETILHCDVVPVEQSELRREE